MLRTFFLHGSNAVLAGGIAALAALFVFGPVHCSPAWAAAGALIFFSSEYTTHRFLFHARPSGVRWLLALQHRLHYDHHIDPSDLHLLFLPVWFTVPVAVLYYGLYFAIARSTDIAFSLTFGSLLALAYYEWVHYVAHVPFNPVTPFGRWMKKYHLWHHFKNERRWFGVTNPSMDFVLGTYEPVTQASRSATTREIWKG